MPSSRNNHIPTILHVVQQLKPSSILDVGTGFGKWGFLFREYTDIRESEHAPERYHRDHWRVVIDGIEGFPNYVTPVHEYIYNRIHIGDMREVLKGLGEYDIVFLGDVIEHLNHEDAAAFLAECIKHSKKAVLVSTPSTFVPQGEACGNPLEVHRSHWTARDFRAASSTAIVKILENEILFAVLPKPGVKPPVIAPSIIRPKRGMRRLIHKAKHWARKLTRGKASPSTRAANGDFNSSTYWERRYQAGGNSGAGSYGILAKYKAAFLSEFIEKESITSVIELGCGDGEQLAMVPYKQYVGLDVSAHIIEACTTRFKADSSKKFLLYNSLSFQDFGESLRAELSLSLDVLYHLVEDDVFDEYLARLFAAAERFVVIYSSNFPQQQASRHVKHREFLPIVTARFTDWTLISHSVNPHRAKNDDDPNGSHADFYIFGRKETNS